MTSYANFSYELNKITSRIEAFHLFLQLDMKYWLQFVIIPFLTHSTANKQAWLSIDQTMGFCVYVCASFNKSN